MEAQSIPDLVRAGDYAQALSLAPEVVGQLPGFEAIQLYRGLALMATGEIFEGGLAVIASCQKNPECVLQLEENWELPPEAQKCAERLLHLLRNPPTAEPDLAVNLSGAADEDQVGAAYHFNACAGFMEAGSLEKALQSALHSWRCAPHYNPGMLAATLAARSGDTRAALAAWEHVLQCKDVDPIGWGARGELKMELGDLQGALQDLDRSVREAPNTPFPLLSRANVKQKLGDVRGARVDRELAYRMEPKLRPARFPVLLFLFLLGVIVTFLTLMVLMLNS